MNLLQFSTVCDLNGNRYQLEIDCQNKAYKVGSYFFTNKGITVTKKAIKEIVYQLDLQGFEQLTRFE